MNGSKDLHAWTCFVQVIRLSIVKYKWMTCSGLCTFHVLWSKNFHRNVRQIFDVEYKMTIFYQLNRTYNFPEVGEMINEETIPEKTIKLAFLGIEPFDDGTAVRGAVLITDSETKPLEFRITSPVRATMFQKMLYGNTLDEYVDLDLISIPLIKALREDVDLIVISSPSLLQIRPKVSLPVALINKQAISTRTMDDKSGSPVQTITITIHTDYPAEKEATHSILQPIIQKRDIFEPFERIKIALAEAHKQKVGESTK